MFINKEDNSLIAKNTKRFWSRGLKPNVPKPKSRESEPMPMVVPKGPEPKPEWLEPETQGEARLAAILSRLVNMRNRQLANTYAPIADS